MRAGIQAVRQEALWQLSLQAAMHTEDSGDTLIYTGAEGSPPVQERGRQICDQDWTGQGNEALRTSQRTGKPVRVVRGYELGSEFAPIYGYRYDGLYTVKAAWKEKNKEGFYLCRYRMERVLGQLPIPVHSNSIDFYLEHGYFP
ncbi:PUA-like domain-containing protein [Suillus subluteus]|nr:PUA-like domain-containing protein [Suillus subluteus]